LPSAGWERGIGFQPVRLTGNEQDAILFHFLPPGLGKSGSLDGSAPQSTRLFEDEFE